MMKKVKKLLKTSKRIFKSCSLKNGAIVASDVTSEDYPRDVKNYFYVWPRDASFVCVACDLLGLKKIPQKFFEWCWERAELFKETGVFLSQKFYPHGRMAGDYDVPLKTQDLKRKKIKEFASWQTNVRLYYTHFQPDQVGSLLWAIHHHSKFSDVGEFKEMIIKAADGICNYWKKDHFKIPSFDLWEEKVALPSLKQIHVYSVAQCIKGLECACELVKPKKRWLICIKQMKILIEKSYDRKLGYFIKTYGKKIDKTLDSSSLGLVWPSGVIEANDERMLSTVNKIIKLNSKKGGIMRYKGDEYDGKISSLQLSLKGAGAWPILNFWLSIYFSLLGEKRKAKKYFNWVLERVEDKIPEQIKRNKPASIIPLAWSHAMFVIAGKILKIL